MKENLYNYNMEIYCENNQEKKKLLNRYSRFQLIEHEFKDTVKRYTIIDKTDLKNIKYSSIYFYRYFINEVKKLFSPLELEYENNVITIINKKELLKKLIDETYNFFIKYPNKIEEMNSILNDMKKGLEYENFEQEIDEESIYPYIFKINLFLDKEEKILKSKSPEIISEYNVPTIINYLIKGIHRNKIKIFFDEKLDEEEVSFEEIKFELKKELNISESEFFDFNFTIKGYYIYNVSTDTVEKIEVDKEIKFYNITTVTKRILELEGFDENIKEKVKTKDIAVMTLDLTEGLMDLGENGQSFEDKYAGKSYFPYVTPYSQSNTGFTPAPEPNDRVALYFPNGNETKAFVIGALNNDGNGRFTDVANRNYHVGDSDFNMVLATNSLSTSAASSISQTASSISESADSISESAGNISNSAKNYSEIVEGSKTLIANEILQVSQGNTNIQSNGDTAINSSGFSVVNGGSNVLING